MNQADELLKKLGLKYEELNATERETYAQWLEGVNTATITLEKVKDYITAMRESVEHELTKYDLTKTEDMFLKARLRNYILLENFLMTPERARKALEQSLRR